MKAEKIHSKYFIEDKDHYGFLRIRITIYDIDKYKIVNLITETSA